MDTRNLNEMKRISPTQLAAGLRSESSTDSIAAAKQFIDSIKGFGVSTADALRLHVQPELEDAASQGRFVRPDGKLMNGLEATLTALQLPIRNDVDSGFSLRLAADTFQTFPGTRAMFPVVIDQMLRWNYRQDLIENVADILAISRSVAGTEVLSTVIPDTQADYQGARPIAELGRIPIASIRATEQTVRLNKFGYGYQTSYEFNRRVSLEMMVPYAQRVQREIERGKLSAAVAMLINGQAGGNATPAPVVNQSSFNAVAGVNSVNGRISMPHLLAWLVKRAESGAPVDTVVGNMDAYIQWLLMFSTPNPSAATVGQQAESMGFRLNSGNRISGVITFAPSFSAPANRLLGFSKADTIEEIVEAGSDIEESERAITNQAITYTKTQNSGFRLIFDDTRSTFNFGA